MEVITIGLLRLIAEDKLIKFYKSKEWRGLRDVALARDHSECQMCKGKGKYRQAECVHHIKEIKQFPSLALVLPNLQSLCADCHNEVHDKLKIKEKSKPKFINEERW